MGFLSFKKLRRLISQTEQLAQTSNPHCPHCIARQQVDALRTTEAMLLRADQDRAKQNGQSVLRAAVAVDHQRRQTKQPRTKSVIHQQRQESANYLAQYSTTTPKPNVDGSSHRLGPMVRRGYMKRTKDGLYLRTAKPYHVNPKAAQ